jgi:hypothetical protein
VLDLDLDLFGKGLAEHVHAYLVHEDFPSGVRSGVNGTPTFFSSTVCAMTIPTNPRPCSWPSSVRRSWVRRTDPPYPNVKA